jgi:hypothetical protein
MENDGEKRLRSPEGDENYHYSGKYSKSENREVKKDNAIVDFREPAKEEEERAGRPLPPLLPEGSQLLIISAIWKATSRLCSALRRGSQVVR